MTITRSRQGYSNLFYEFPAGRLDNVGLIAAWAISPGDPFGNYHGDSNYLTGTTNFVLSNETTDDPTLAPTLAPSIAPTLAPSGAPSLAPTHAPSLAPTYAPTDDFWTRYDLWGKYILIFVHVYAF